MKLRKVTIHNIRSVQHATFEVSNYSILVGENNVGKTNIFTALRLFYEDNLKYKREVDFPKNNPSDPESWIELAFETTEDEQKSLKSDYQSQDRILKVRRFFESNNNLVKSGQSNIYAYESGELSKSLFYGAKNISQTKLGKIIHIPAVNITNDNLKLSGPSPFRKMLNFVMERAVHESPSFKNLSNAFNQFNSNFRKESSSEGLSVNSLIDKINSEIGGWNVLFDISVNSLKPEEIVKHFLSDYIKDVNLDSNKIDVDLFGQGFQRRLIYTLIKLSSQYIVSRSTKKKDFDPNFNLLLFEEPEAFLHPSQQQFLCLSLRELGNGNLEQVLVSTHSPHFVSKQTSCLTGIIKLSKEKGVTTTFQIKKDDLRQIHDKNTSLYKTFSDCLKSEDICAQTKKYIEKNKLGDKCPNLKEKLDEEYLNYFLWLDSEKTSLFFAQKVILCEGASEKIFIDYMIDTEWSEFRERNIYLLNVQGKYNIHRYMALLAALGIEHSVLVDSDGHQGIHKIIHEFLEERKTNFTKKIHYFDKDFEKFLEIEKPNRNDMKPLNVMMKYQRKEIPSKKIEELKNILNDM
ncbi:MAG: AAA family ATPase [Flavobacteriaceae bacterium]|nr:AAA family ATPase [Flavobacteriaceae bacterium]